MKYRVEGRQSGPCGFAQEWHRDLKADGFKIDQIGALIFYNVWDSNVVSGETDITSFAPGEWSVVHALECKETEC